MRRVATAAGLVVAAWSLGAGFHLVVTLHDARSAEIAAQSLREGLSGSDVLAPSTAVRIRASARRLDRARAGARSLWLRPLRSIPGAATQLRAMDRVLSSGAAASHLAADAATSLRTAAAGSSGPIASQLQTIAAAKRIAVRSQQGLQALEDDLPPRAGLIGPVADARARLARTFRHACRVLRRASRGMSGVIALLRGPRRYLVLAANNAEMRAGSGMYLRAGVLRIERGHATLSRMISTKRLLLRGRGVRGYDHDIEQRWGWYGPNIDLRSNNVSPRFDVTAPLAARIWQAKRGGRLDGVVVVDSVALSSLLELTGPVRFGSRVLDSSNALRELLQGQYVHSAGRTQRRHERLGAMAARVLALLTHRRLDTRDLLATVERVARGRHLLVWSKLAQERSAWRLLGVDGALRDDSVLVAVLNLGANKLDPFLAVRTDLTWRRRPAGTDVTITIRLRNQTPPGLSSYVTRDRDHDQLPYGTYFGILSVTIPSAATTTWFSAQPSPWVNGPDGPTRVIALPVKVHRGRASVNILHFSLPATESRLMLQPSARVPPIATQIRGHTLPSSSASAPLEIKLTGSGTSDTVAAGPG